MSDKIAEIRARHALSAWWSTGYSDRATLLAEVERQSAEIEALHEALRRGAKELFVVERSTTGPDTPVAFIMEGKP